VIQRFLQKKIEARGASFFIVGSVTDPECLSKIQALTFSIPDPTFFIPDPRSRVDKIPDPSSGSAQRI
jgi:hypothetical protein